MEDPIKRRRELAKKLKGLADKHSMVDVGFGVAEMLEARQVDLDVALMELKNDGYLTYGGRIPSATAGWKTTTIKVLCKPGVDRKDIYTDKVYHLA